LLIELGYSKVVDFAGGLQEWVAAGRALETTNGGARSSAGSTNRQQERRSDGKRVERWLNVLLDRVSSTQLLYFWVAMVLFGALAAWCACGVEGQALSGPDGPIGFDLEGLITSLYFSLVTATSLGYGDIQPHGVIRFLAVSEAAAGLLVVGALISKVLSHRSEELTLEIHRLTFEDRLGRVQANLHNVLTDLQRITVEFEERPQDRERLRIRLDSVASLFSGELSAVHDLLYRPQNDPSAETLEALLVTLHASLTALGDVRTCSREHAEDSSETSMLEGTLNRAGRLALQICGECVPRTYEPALARWMDRVQVESRRLLAD
jgi:hypothetical protein